MAGQRLSLKGSTVITASLASRWKHTPLLRPGMSDIDALNIIGKEGKEQSNYGGVVTKCWQDKGKSIVLTIRDGTIVG